MNGSRGSRIAYKFCWTVPVDSWRDRYMITKDTLAKPYFVEDLRAVI